MDDRDDDIEIETRLRRFQPVGPPAMLRARVLAAAHGPGLRARVMWWSIAAAVATVVLLHWQSARLYRDLAEPEMRASQDRRVRQIDAVAEAWGGTATARAAAEAAWIEIDAARQRADTSSSTPPPVAQGQP
jgi:hypothetical protein